MKEKFIVVVVEDDGTVTHRDDQVFESVSEALAHGTELERCEPRVDWEVTSMWVSE